MSFGIGLGAFMQGVEGGYGLGQKISAGMDAKAKKDSLKAVDTAAKQDFDQQVADGKEAPGNFDAFYRQNYLPQKIRAYEAAGDVEGAATWLKWAEAKGGYDGSKLFASGMFKAQAGDVRGAVGDFIQAGRTKGYLSHGYQIGDVEEIAGAGGAGSGFRVQLKSPDGTATPIEFNSAADVIQFGANYLNPDAAWKSWQTDAAAARKMKADIAEDRAKLGNRREDAAIRRAAGIGATAAETPEKQYDSARKALADGDPNFPLLTPEEQQKKIMQQVEQRRAGVAKVREGAAMAPGITAPVAPQQNPVSRKVLVDSVTGQPVDPMLVK